MCRNHQKMRKTSSPDVFPIFFLSLRMFSIWPSLIYSTCGWNQFAVFLKLATFHFVRQVWKKRRKKPPIELMRPAVGSWPRPIFPDCNWRRKSSTVFSLVPFPVCVNSLLLLVGQQHKGKKKKKEEETIVWNSFWNEEDDDDDDIMRMSIWWIFSKRSLQHTTTGHCCPL